MAHWFVEPDGDAWAVRNGRRQVRTGLDQDEATDYVLGLLKGTDTAVLIEPDGYRKPLRKRRKRRPRV